MRKKLMLFMISFLLTGCGVSHIEDTNGLDNYNLQTLTEDDLLKTTSSYVARNYISISKGNEIKCGSQKFSGIKTLEVINIKDDCIFTFESNVSSGNFLIAIVNNDGIEGYVSANEYKTFRFSSDFGNCKLKVAGESAEFELKVTITYL